jgi:hypothetical protein
MALHLHLNGEGAAPEEWALSVLCESFGYTLRQALWELYGVRWEQAPAGLHWTILQLRAYAQAWEIVKHGDDAAKRRCPMTARVYEIIGLIAEQKRAEHEQRATGHHNQGD